MLFIDKSHVRQPQILALAIQEMKRTPGQVVCYDNLSHVVMQGKRLQVRDELLKQLIEDQRGLCAYCMCRIHPEDAHIEHYIPRHCDWYNGKPTLDELSLDYRNMLAVCKDKGTCDATRGNEKLTVDPRRETDVDQIRYERSSCTITSSNQAIENDCNTLLNLNDKYLARGRKLALAGLFRWYEKSARSGDMRAKCQKYLDKLEHGSGSNAEYAGLLIYELRRKVHALG